MKRETLDLYDWIVEGASWGYAFYDFLSAGTKQEDLREAEVETVK